MVTRASSYHGYKSLQLSWMPCFPEIHNHELFMSKPWTIHGINLFSEPWTIHE